MKCTDCGKTIKNAYFFRGKPYGKSCYKKQLTIAFKQFEDEKNAEWQVKCFAAIEIFRTKKDSSFKLSITEQWNDCKKLTAKQYECIKKGFTPVENLNYLLVYGGLSDGEKVSSRIYNAIAEHNLHTYVIENIELFRGYLQQYFNHGFFFYKDLIGKDQRIILAEIGTVKKDKVTKEYSRGVEKLEYYQENEEYEEGKLLLVCEFAETETE